MAENKMKNYDGVNNSWGTTTIKVLFQVRQYKGSMTYTVGGNCKGLEALPRDGLSIIENLESAKFKGMTITPFDDDEWFAKVVLTADDGDTLKYDVESEVEFEQMIIGMQIIDFVEEMKMAENKMEQVAAMFGKKLWEEFTVVIWDVMQKCKFTDAGLKVKYPDGDWHKSDNWLRCLLIGEAEIVEDEE